MGAEPFMRFVVYFGTDSQVALVVKNLPASAGDLRDVGSIPVSGTSPGGEHDDPLWSSRLENPMERSGRLSIVLHRVGHD